MTLNDRGPASIRVATDEEAADLLALQGPDGKNLTMDRGGRRIELLDLDAIRAQSTSDSAVSLETWEHENLHVEIYVGGHVYEVTFEDPLLCAMLDTAVDAARESTITENIVFKDPRVSAMAEVIGAYLVATKHRRVHPTVSPVGTARTVIRDACRNAAFTRLNNIPQVG